MADLRAGFELMSAMRSQWWPADRLERVQSRRLEQILVHASSHVPYYKRLGLELHGLSALQALQRFPDIRKVDIQAAGTDLVAERYSPDALPSSRTSGSTGEPTVTWFDPASWRFTRHVLKWRRVLSSTSPFRLRLLRVSDQPGHADGVERGPRLPGVFEVRTISIAMEATRALALLRGFRPNVIYAYPSWLREVIEVARADQGGLPAVPCIMTSSEVLTAADRASIGSAFSGRIFDVYGNTELKEVAWQCDHGRYHVNVESVFVEIDAPAHGQIGEIVLTGLVNRAMPLIRFRTGDLGRWATGACACGRAAPALAEIQGRVAEMIVLPHGRRISPYLLTTAIEQDDGVRHYRIEQHGESRIVVRYRPREGRHVSERRISERASAVLGAGVGVECVSDPEMAPPGRGKRSVYQRIS